jgi:hypothetical protein
VDALLIEWYQFRLGRAVALSGVRTWRPIPAQRLGQPSQEPLIATVRHALELNDPKLMAGA